MPTPVYTRPGVYTSESLLAQPPATVSLSPSQAGFAGEHWYGVPGVAFQCNSWNDFQKYFGGFNPNTTPVLTNPYFPYGVYSFFANGGNTAFCQRIVNNSGSAGAAASTTLLPDGNATPQFALQLIAGCLGNSGNIGSWGNTLYVDLYAGSSAGRFGLTIYKGGYGTQYVVEQWPDLSMLKTDYRYAVSILNSPTSGSLYVFAVDNNTNSTYDYSTIVPISGQQFTGGIDPGAPGSVDWTNAVTVGTSPFDTVPGVLNFALPGETALTVVDAALSYANARPSTFYVIDPPANLTPAAAITYFGTLGPVTAQAALYYPWVIAQNPASSNLQQTTALPPSGFVLGQMTAVDTAHGPWQAPAGTSTSLVGVVQAQTNLTPTNLGSLNQANVNALRTMSSGQVVIWGARTMSPAFSSLYVPISRTLNFIAASATSILETSVFAPNDQASWTTIVNELDQFLGGLLSQGAFPSTSAATSYYVTCDTTNNTPTSISQGILNVTIGVALIYPAEFIQLNIQQFQGGATTVNITT